MSIYWKSPHDGQCCECRPNVCDPCDSCPTGESVEVTLSGIAACCTTDSSRLNGLGSVNGTHALTRLEDGTYSIVLTAAVSLDWFAELDCETLFSTDEPDDVQILFSCGAELATLDVRLVASGTRLFYNQITPPAPGEVFVFHGGESCSAFTPYTYGGSATLSA